MVTIRSTKESVMTVVVVVAVGLMSTCLCLTDDDTLRPIISTAKGRIRGVRTFFTTQQIPVDRFLGIPYAQPPIGQRRFRKPMEAQTWNDVREASEYQSACYHDFQNTGFRGDDMWNPTVPVSEDCLYLNIWVPRNIQRPMTKLATLVWIYGGGFVSGSADLPTYDGSFLAATHNAIVVSMNYRLGSLGFLSLGTPDAPGNMGLMDQSMAIKWAHDNIEAFGGDRDKIALFGESAGSASVSYHLLAQPSWEYFSYAIMESGVAVAPWAFTSPRKLSNYSRMYAREVGCTNDDSKQILDCLRNKTPRELSSKFMTSLDFIPTVDGTFITKPPKDLVREKRFKRCNILLGYNTDEQTYFMHIFYPEKFGRNLRGTPSVSEGELSDLLRHISLSKEQQVPNSSFAFQNLRQVYINSVPPQIRGENFKVLDDMAGDYDFKCPITEFANAYAEQNLGVYFYHFDHRSPTNPWPEWMGVIHGYEIEFVFGLPYNSSSGYTTEDKRISDVMMSYWVTFASTGNPNAGGQNFGERFWPNYTTGEQNYKVLKSDLLETKQYPRYAQCAFWKDFVPVLTNYTETAAIAFARCSGSQNYATAFSILLSVVFSSFLTLRNE